MLVFKVYFNIFLNALILHSELTIRDVGRTLGGCWANIRDVGRTLGDVGRTLGMLGEH